MKHQTFPISRRDILKLTLGSGAILYLRPFSGLNCFAAENKSNFQYSPIDRLLPDKAAKEYFGDNPSLAHKILWDKAGFIKSLGGKLPEPSESVPLVVIGGGMSGLVSAYLLREHKPIILEQASRFGGNSKGQSWRGIDYSIGAAYFVEPEKGSKIDLLLKELGIDKLTRLKTGEDPTAISGSIYRKFWEGEAIKDKPEEKEEFKLLANYFSKVFEGTEISFPEIPTNDLQELDYVKKLDKISFLAHLEQVAGKKLCPLIETAIEHYCWSSFGGSSHEISAAAGLNFYCSEFGNLGVLPGGNAAIAEKLVESLNKSLPNNSLRHSSLVFDVKVDSGGVVISYLDSSSQIRSVRADSLIMSCPKFVAKHVIRDLEPERLEAISKLRYRSYLVANVCLNSAHDQSLYDLYLLGKGKLEGDNAYSNSKTQGVTDVILANYARPGGNNTVLTLYRGIPYDGARAELYAPDSYQRIHDQFEKQIIEEILPLLAMKKESIVDLRIARWGHPLPLAATGLIADGTVETLRKPFREKVFFIEQDNWALPAFETAVEEAIYWAPKVKASLA